MFLPGKQTVREVRSQRAGETTIYPQTISYSTQFGTPFHNPAVN